MRYIFIAQVLVLLVICSSKPKEDNKRLHPVHAQSIQIPQAKEMDINDVVAEWDTIRMEASSPSLLTGIKKLEVADDKLYILDGSSSLLFIFNKEGGYLSKIDNQGQGPQEYIKIFDFEVDKTNHRILATDAFSKRLFIYDMMGNLQKVIPLDFPPFHLSSDASQRLIHLCSTARELPINSLEKNNVAIINEEGGIETAFLPDETPRRLDIVPILTNNLTSEGEILYMPIFSDVIYRIHDAEAIPEYILQNQTGKKNLTVKDKEELFYTYDRNNLDEYESEGYFLPSGNFLNHEDWLMVASGWEETMLTFYNKRLKNSISIQAESLKGDKGLCEILMTYPQALDNGWFYVGISSDMRSYLLDILSEGKVRTFFQSTVAEDNPSLIRYRLNPAIFGNTSQQ